MCAGDLGACEANTLGNFYLCLANQTLRGDGLCDMLNNIKECDYDKGDCESRSNYALFGVKIFVV